MAFAVVQHQAGTRLSSDGSGNTAATAWPGNTGAGNLLLAVLGFSTNATVTCSTSGWVQAITFRNGTGNQVEIWYSSNSAGTDASPVFVITPSSLYVVNVAEISGVSTTSPLDKTGTATGGTVAVVQSAGTSQAAEFVFGVARLKNASGITPTTWTLPSTSGAGATFGADIDSLGAVTGVNNFGLLDSWATSGAIGSTPLFDFTCSGGTPTQTCCIATFGSSPVNAAPEVDVHFYRVPGFQ